MPRFLPQPEAEMLSNYRQTLWRPTTYLLDFSYGDISDIFVPEGETPTLHDAIDGLNATEEEKKALKIKVKEV